MMGVLRETSISRNDYESRNRRRISLVGVKGRVNKSDILAARNKSRNMLAVRNGAFAPALSSRQHT